MNEYGVNINFKREEENQVDLSIFNEWPQEKSSDTRNVVSGPKIICSHLI